MLQTLSSLYNLVSLHRLRKIYCVKIQGPLIFLDMSFLVLRLYLLEETIEKT